MLSSKLRAAMAEAVVRLEATPVHRITDAERATVALYLVAPLVKSAGWCATLVALAAEAEAQGHDKLNIDLGVLAMGLSAHDPATPIVQPLPPVCHKCHIPSLAAARQDPRLMATMHADCPEHGRAALPYLWRAGLHDQPKQALTVTVWYGYDRLFSE
jgi:hypothetical protein